MSNILLTDSRDVIFQGNPFNHSSGELVSGVENNLIGNCPFNSAWILGLFGQNILDRISDHPIICSGVTLGNTENIKFYLEQMCKTIWHYIDRINSQFGFDQGVHNYLIRNQEVPIKLSRNENGIIATLGYENPDNIYLDFDNGLLTVNGTIPKIVHQYDRHVELEEFFEFVVNEKNNSL